MHMRFERVVTQSWKLDLIWSHNATAMRKYS